MAQIVPTAAALCQGQESRGAMRDLIAQKAAAAVITSNGTMTYRLRRVERITAGESINASRSKKE